MKSSTLKQVVEAVLYEGYILYPYRASATKNRQPFTFGRVYPQAYSAALKGAEPCQVQTEVLARLSAAQASLKVSVRFLHPMRRESGSVSLSSSSAEPASEGALELVEELAVESASTPICHEAVERQVRLGRVKLSLPGQGTARGTGAAAPLEQVVSFDCPGMQLLEPAPEAGQPGRIAFRSQQALSGVVELSVSPLADSVVKISVRVRNETPIERPEWEEPESLLMRTFASTHTVLELKGAEFISLMEPPPQHRAAASSCLNQGTWPVLVGDAKAGRRDTMLSSPIILYDYPQVAPESPGSFFDGTEIDELLSLRILTMTDAEKDEMRQAGEQARRLLERTEASSPEQLARLHGTMRQAPSPVEEIFGANTPLEQVFVQGVRVRSGARVRLRPKAGGDVWDLALKGMTAVVEAVEQDADDRIYLAVVLEQDPGKDLGWMRQPGHRFFFGIDEVEPLPPQAASA